jgi:hypothetical protein
MASEHPLSGLMFKQDEYFQLRDETDLARTRELQKEMMERSGLIAGRVRTLFLSTF